MARWRACGCCRAVARSMPGACWRHPEGPRSTLDGRGDEPVVHVALEEPQGHDDAILDPDQRVWGFECNFGGMGELCVARGDQLRAEQLHHALAAEALEAARIDLFARAHRISTSSSAMVG